MASVKANFSHTIGGLLLKEDLGPLLLETGAEILTGFEDPQIQFQSVKLNFSSDTE